MRVYNMNVYISVISHGHSELINELSCLSDLSNHFKVVVKSNKPNDCFRQLALNPNFHWLDNRYGCGFGHNNNIVFEYCQSELSMSDNDVFIVLNPDVIITVDSVKRLLSEMYNKEIKISAINLFKNKELTEFDNSIRHFPSLKQFVKSFLGLGNCSIIDKNKLTMLCSIDWAAGSFLAFKALHYKILGGFDEKYFMYCEDIDLCYRSNKIKVPVTYHPNIVAIHLAQHANRKIFSRHFYWHVSSVFRFLLSKLGMTKPSSSMKK
jgi:hypothetical protein